MTAAAALVASTLRGVRWPGCADEYVLQDVAAQLLAAVGLRVIREVMLVDGRIDLVVGETDSVGVECKVDGSSGQVLRQLELYARDPSIAALVLLTRKATHRGLPSTVGHPPKPLHVVLVGQVL